MNTAIRAPLPDTASSQSAAPQASPQGEVTLLLLAWQEGDHQAAESLLPLVFSELHKIASIQLTGERKDHTLQPTALVNEAYLRLVDQTSPWRTRAHFFALSARTIRRILIDHARRNQCAKRGSGLLIQLEDSADQAIETAEEFEALDLALTRLEAVDPLKARIVEQRFFGGLTGEEIAAVEALSPATVQRHWQLARAWLYREIRGEEVT